MFSGRVAAITGARLERASSVGGIEAVFLAHRKELVRFFRVRAPGEDSEDLAQELWIRLQSANTGPIADPLPYLYRMANNLALDLRRSAVRRLRRDHLWATESEPRSGPLATVSGERVILSRDRLRQVEERLEALGERTSTIVRLFRIHGVPQERIASELGISLSAVEKHLQKAYRALLSIEREGDDGK